jgi:hypothetical protein
MEETTMLYYTEIVNEVHKHKIGVSQWWYLANTANNVDSCVKFYIWYTNYTSIFIFYLKYFLMVKNINQLW